jgi:hypothetical protein
VDVFAIELFIGVHFDAAVVFNREVDRVRHDVSLLAPPVLAGVRKERIRPSTKPVNNYSQELQHKLLFFQ